MKICQLPRWCGSIPPANSDSSRPATAGRFISTDASAAVAPNPRTPTSASCGKCSHFAVLAAVAVWFTRDNVRSYEDGRANPQLQPAIDTIGENTERISRDSINDVHQDQHDRHKCCVDADAVRLQDQKRVTEPRQRQQACNRDRPPKGVGKKRELASSQQKRPRGKLLRHLLLDGEN